MSKEEEEEKEITTKDLKSLIDSLGKKVDGFGKRWLIGWGFAGFLFLLSYFLNRRGVKDG